MPELTMAEARIEVRSLLNEPTAHFWTDLELEDYIQEGAVDVSAKTLCYEVVTSQTLSDNIIEYAEPTDTIKVLSCTLFDDSEGTYRGLQKIHPRMMNHVPNNDAGLPYYYYHFAGKVGVYPVPEVDASDAIYIYHASISDDITALPDKAQSPVIEYAAAMGLFKARRNTEAVALYTNYLNSLRFLRADLHTMDVESKDMMAPPDRVATR